MASYETVPFVAEGYTGMNGQTYYDASPTITLPAGKVFNDIASASIGTTYGTAVPLTLDTQYGGLRFYYSGNLVILIPDPSVPSYVASTVMSQTNLQVFGLTIPTSSGPTNLNLYIVWSSGGAGGGGNVSPTGKVVFPFILQQDAGADLDVVGEVVTNNLVPHVTLDYYVTDLANIFSQDGSAADRVAVSLSGQDADFSADISGFISDVEQSLKTFNKWLGGYDHAEFVATACTSLESLSTGLGKETASAYTSNIFEQLVGIDASAISLSGGVMSFDLTNIQEFHVVSRVSTTYSIGIDTSKPFSVTGVPGTIQVDYSTANPVTASRPWYVLTRIHNGTGAKAIAYDTTGTAPDA